MKYHKPCLSVPLLIVIGLCVIFESYSQTDTSSLKIDTSDYIKGDKHFNLIIAADKGYDKEVLRLLNKGAYINTQTSEGVTALMYAVENQHVMVVKILLANGANPNLEDFNGAPALIPAVKKGNTEIVELLLRKGADINKRDDSKRTPLMYAVWYNDFLLADMLIYYDADVNLTDNEGNSALNIAAYYGYTDIVKLLTEHKATLEKPDNKKFTPLHSSSQNGHLQVVDYLISQGANTSLETSAGYTPLALAVKNNQYTVTETLIDKGADVNANTAIATSPLNIAKSNRNDSLSNLLKANGAVMFRRPAFQYYSLNFDMSFNSDDLFMGGGLGLHDTRYGLSATLGIVTRITAKPILEETDVSDTYYQYWERRTYTYLGVFKRFRIFALDKNSSGGLYAGGQLIYSFGNYRGADKKPDPRFMVSPVGGAYLQFRRAILTLGYEYVNFKIEKVSPGRVKFGIVFLIPGKGMNQPVNKTLWAE